MWGRVGFFAALTSLVALPAVTGAAVIYSGGTYSQNFDSLPNTPPNASLGNTPIGWTDDNAAPAAGNFSIVGWYLRHPVLQTEGGFNGRQRMRIGIGSSSVGAFWSYGASGNTDRALSSLAATTTAAVGATQYIAVRLTNTTPDILTSFTLSFDGEQWRDGGLGTAETLAFEWSTTATDAHGAGYTAATQFDFVSPVFTATPANVNGNTTGKVAISGTVTGMTWAPGTDLWLRWGDNKSTATGTTGDHGMGIDNLSFLAEVPEPTSFAVLGLGALGILARRRR